MRCTQATEIVTLHGTGKALTDRSARDVHELTFDEVVRLKFSTHFDKVVFAHAELDDLALGLDLGSGVMSALGLAYILDLDRACAELQRDIAVLVLRPLAHHLAALQRQNGNGYMSAVIGEDAGHSQLLCDQSRTHRLLPSLYLAAFRVIVSQEDPLKRKPRLNA